MNELAQQTMRNGYMRIQSSGLAGTALKKSRVTPSGITVFTQPELPLKGADGGAVRMGLVREIHPNHVVVGDRGSSERVPVAKPYSLRRDPWHFRPFHFDRFGSLSNNVVTYRYLQLRPNESELPEPSTQRIAFLATSSGFIALDASGDVQLYHLELIRPSYETWVPFGALAQEHFIAFARVESTGVDEAPEWLDMNMDGRAWASVGVFTNVPMPDDPIQQGPGP